MKTARCSSQKCNAPIVWCVTVNGKRTPVDAGVSERGTYTLTDRGDEPPLAEYVKKEDRPGKQLHEAHWGSCLDRGTFVKKAATA